MRFVDDSLIVASRWWAVSSKSATISRRSAVDASYSAVVDCGSAIVFDQVVSRLA
jgi:hypothetical protein